MKVLIVDDSQKKIEAITKVLSSQMEDYYVIINESYKDALKNLLSMEDIKLMILDINLPIMKGEGPNKKGGISLLNEVHRNQKIHKPESIIGLTQYDDIEELNKDLFEKEGWILSKYSQSEDDWKEIIRNKLNYLNSRFDGGNSLFNEWWVRSLIIGFVIGLGVFMITLNFTISIIALIVSGIFLIFRNPKRRFFRAGLTMIGLSAINQLPWIE